MEATESTVPAGGTETENVEPEQSGTIDYEAIAKEKGWRPKEEFEGEVDNWIGAEEFIKRQPLFDKIKVQSKKLKELEKTVEALAKHYQTNIHQAKEKALAELKAERREAIELGESAKVDEIDERIEHVKKMDAPAVQQGLAPEIEDFIDKQKDWFNKDEEMTAFAVAYNESFLRRNPGDLAKSLDETMKAVRKAFPDKFTNQRRSAPPAVEGGAAPKSTEKYSMSRLNSEQKIVYEQLVKRHKQMTHEAYFKSLEEAGFLEA